MGGRGRTSSLRTHTLSDFIIMQFLSSHNVLKDYADAAYSYRIMIYGYT